VQLRNCYIEILEVAEPEKIVPHGAHAFSLCAGHAQQLGGESPLPNLMEVKG